MTMKHLRELIAHYASEAKQYEEWAVMCDLLFDAKDDAAKHRLKAEFHHNTVVHLEELVAGLTEAHRILSNLQIPA